MASVDVTRIASNIQALNALNSLQLINAKLAAAQNRLSTGKRINSAADDPAGLTIATKMMARSEGLKASIDNISDAKNMLSVAEGGLSTMTDIMIAMRTKAEKAASDTLGNSERATIQTQLSAYAQQIQDLVDQTKWNGVKLLDNSTGPKTFQTGVDEGETTTWTLPNSLDPAALSLSTKVTAVSVTSGPANTSFSSTAINTGTLGNLSELTTGDYKFKILDKATSTLFGKVNLDASNTLSAGISTFSAATSALTAGANIMTSGTYTFKVTGSTTTSVSYEITKLGDTTFGTNGTLSVSNASVTATGFLVDQTNVSLGLAVTSSSWFSVAKNQTIKFEYIAKGEVKYAMQDTTGQAQLIAQDSGATRTGFVGYGLAGVTAAGGSTLMIDTGRGVKTSLGNFGTVSATTNYEQLFTYERANNYSVNVSNAYRGGAYMTTVTNALDKVTSALSDLGSLMARLTYKEEQSATANVNLEGAYSRIMNSNMAEEQVNASKYTILQQTATAMLAQANAAPQSLLTLFR